MLQHYRTLKDIKKKLKKDLFELSCYLKSLEPYSHIEEY